TLRYYDKIGLLKPAEVDRFTSYRYYSANQLPRLNRILALKGLDLSLEQIAQLLESDLPPDQIRGMLRLKQAEIQEQLREEQALLAQVEWRLSRIELEESMPAQEVVRKNIPALPVAAVRDIIPTYSDISRLYGELFAYLGQHRINPTGPPLAVYYDEEYRDRDADVEAAMPVAGQMPAGARVRGRELPPVEQMACITHEGAYEAFDVTYGQLMAWVEANGYRMSGPIREIYVRGPESSEEPSTYITEIQLPVEKAE
ncbi:MAG: MerR family transcriptional regulator, partial [Anaerolineales bacterium]